MRSTLRSLVLLPALLVLAACTMWKEGATPAWKTATGGEQLERLFWQEIKGKNWAELEKHLGPLYVNTSPNGTLDRATYLQDVQKATLTDFSIADFQIKPAGDSIITTYTVTLTGEANGKPFPVNTFRTMSVWQQVKGGWILVAQSQMPVAKP